MRNIQQLVSCVKKLPSDEKTLVLAVSKKDVEEINNALLENGVNNQAEAITYQSVKGLEAENIVLYDFRKFVRYSQSEPDILYRKIYVILTRAQKRLFVSIPSDSDSSDIVAEVESQIAKHERNNEDKETVEVISDFDCDSEWKGKVAKLRPVARQAKECGEAIVTASELFALIGGLFM